MNEFNTACRRSYYVDLIEPLYFSSKEGSKNARKFSGVFCVRLLSCSKSTKSKSFSTKYVYVPSKFINPEIISYYVTNFPDYFSKDENYLHEVNHESATVSERSFVEIDLSSNAYKRYKEIVSDFSILISDISLAELSNQFNSLDLNFLPIKEKESYNLLISETDFEDLEFSKHLAKASSLVFENNCSEITNNSSLPKAIFYNVGQGDMSLFISSTGIALLTDCYIEKGKRKKIIDKVKEYADKIATELKSHNIHQIDCFIISHFHSDHYKKAESLLEVLEKDHSITVKHILVTSSYYFFYSKTIKNNYYTNREVIAFFKKFGTKIKVIVGELQVVNNSKTLIYCCSPTKSQIATKKNAHIENLNSIVTFIIDSNRLFILTGDCDIETQIRYIQEFKNYVKDLILNHKSLPIYSNYKVKEVILKVSHHGSKNGTDIRLVNEILRLVRFFNKNANSSGSDVNDHDFDKVIANAITSNTTKLSFISCGNNQQYKHPDIEAVCALNYEPSFKNNASECNNTITRNMDLVNIYERPLSLWKDEFNADCLIKRRICND